VIPVTFEFSEKNSALEIIGEEFDFNSFKNLLSLLQKIENESNFKKLRIIGNFKTKLLLESMIVGKGNIDLDNTLNTLHSVSKILQESKILFTSEIKGEVMGPAMEIALLCNFIKAEKSTILKLNETKNGIMPFLGTTQRLTRLIGYNNALKAFLIDKELNYDQCISFDLFNNTKDNFNKIGETKNFWDQTFTNTFIFYNSKMLSLYKNQKPEYSAILSTIFESSVCHYDSGLSIEKKWLKWLINHKLFSYK
tara:strand:- start:808 stop:1563 length:756 start_codon:yes stop_codon:yes gene_type:complete